MSPQRRITLGLSLDSSKQGQVLGQAISLVFLLLLVGVVTRESRAQSATRDMQLAFRSGSYPRRVVVEEIPNVVAVHPQVYSGAVPAGDVAFKKLQELGIKTIISVDGARPNVTQAAQFGLRYVHLPHGYDSISWQRSRELAKGVLTLEGPIYIHCHHGKHRSPAAAAVACVGAGLLNPNQALKVLELAGTSHSYRGLFKAAQEARPIARQEMDRLTVDFREQVSVPPLAEAMVDIEETFSRLEQVQSAGWKVPANHPDVDPAHEALMLQEHYTELLRSELIVGRVETFRRLLSVGKELATDMTSALDRPQESRQVSGVDQIWRKLQQNCQDCHRQFRDNPPEVKKGEENRYFRKGIEDPNVSPTEEASLQR